MNTAPSETVPAGTDPAGPHPADPRPGEPDPADTDPDPIAASASAGLDRPPLRRLFEGRMLTGVCAGVAEYFGIDVTLVRIAFVVLTFVGGAGIPLYLAGLLLIPEEGSDQSIAASLLGSLQGR